MTGTGQETPVAALTEDRPIGEEGRRSLQAYIAGLTAPMKVDLAAKGNREVRNILSRDMSSIVARAVMASPKLSEQDILSYVASSQTHEEILRAIGESRQWTANRQVVSALVQNPRTPPPVAIRFLRAFQANELRILMQNRGLSVVVRQEARRLVAQRH